GSRVPSRLAGCGFRRLPDEVVRYLEAFVEVVHVGRAAVFRRGNVDDGSRIALAHARGRGGGQQRVRLVVAHDDELAAADQPALPLVDGDAADVLAVLECVVVVALAFRQPVLFYDLAYLSLARLGLRFRGVAAIELLIASDLGRLLACALGGLLLRGRRGRRRLLLLAALLFRLSDLLFADETGLEQLIAKCAHPLSSRLEPGQL